MKRYLLDTNICIFYMKGKYDLLARLEKAGRRNCCISEIRSGGFAIRRSRA